MAKSDNGVDAKRQPKPKIPDDFESEETFLEFVRNRYAEDVEYDRENMEEDYEDGRFVAGKQWEEQVYNKRVNVNKKPALTINRLPAYVAQVVGNRLQNETQIRVLPDRNGTKEIARVREDLIRNIQKNTRAQRAFNIAFRSQVIGGIGNFRVSLEYADDDAFEQDIKIDAIPNSRSVVWDRLHTDPTGADAGHVSVTDRMPRDVFKKMYPDAGEGDLSNTFSSYPDLERDGWIDRDTVRVVEFWRMRSRERTIALLDDGDVVEVTDETDLARVQTRPDGSPVMRRAKSPYAEMYLVTGASVLEGPYELPIKRVPVFRVPGWEINVNDTKYRWGLVRFMRDPQRLHNFWRSIIAEKLLQTPRAKWIATKEAVAGREKQFRESHLSDDPLLVWNGEAGQKPEIVQPAQMEPALIQAAAVAAQDLKDVSNLHEASLGQTSNEVSGKAIMARQRVGETGTVIYETNLNMAIEECGRVINDLIPFTYDTPRIVKIMGEDAQDAQTVEIGPGTENDITVGKYSVTIVTGPSSATKRIETAESMMAAVNAMPQTFQVAADLIAEAQDWNGADKIARRLRSTMPPEVLGDDVPPERQAQLNQQAQIQQQAAQLQAADAMADIELKKAQIEEKRARAAQIMASIERDNARAVADIDSQQTRDALQTIDAIEGENNVSG